jgi:Flp pilus assembly protein TadG
MSRPRPATSSRRSERGSATIELLILLPALFAVMFIGVQAALYHHARQVAIAAAQEGARTAAGEHGSEAAGTTAATTFVADAGGDDVLAGAAVSASRSATTAVVVVTGRSLSVVPGWNPVVRQRASMPVERVTAP